MRLFHTFFGFAVAITTCASALAQRFPLNESIMDHGATAPKSRLDAPKIRWGAGLRTQSVFVQGQNLPWLELGLDGVVYPWKHLGLGLTGLIGTLPMMQSGCELEGKRDCSPNWRMLTPFVEYRILPRYLVSPYARQSLGMAWGTFALSTDPNSVAFVSRTEFGIDLHYGASIRLYAAAERLDGSRVDSGGFGGGIQVGLNI
jgi:hypothetical protein